MGRFFRQNMPGKCLLALIFPVPVFLNLLAAPRLVFNFGTWFSPHEIVLVGRVSERFTNTNHQHRSPPSMLVFGSGEELRS